MNVYFDNAATTPLREEVIREMEVVMKNAFGNPSSTHAFGRKAKAYVETARKSIAVLLNALPQEIIFTSGGTESDNMLLRCAVKDLGIQTIISSPLEHHAVLHTLDDLENVGVNVAYVKVNTEGVVDLDDLERLLKKGTDKKLVTLMHINNEIGTILDVDTVANLCQQHQAYFHTDAVQSVGHYPIDLSATPIDFLSAAAHKFHGPKGIGFSFIRKKAGLKPFIAGGAQERGLRAGTESVHNVVGMQVALEIAYQKLEEEREYIHSLKTYFINQLKEVFPKSRCNGLSGTDKGTYTLVNVALPIANEKAMLLDFHMDLKGIACSKGSACQSGSAEGSHVLKQLKGNAEDAYPSLRFSFSAFNTRSEIDYVVRTLQEFANS